MNALWESYDAREETPDRRAAHGEQAQGRQGNGQEARALDRKDRYVDAEGGQQMKALSLTQPYASLIAAGEKHIETRSFNIKYRGPIAIHSSKGFPGEYKRLCESRMVCWALGWQACPPSLTQEWCDRNKADIQSLPLGRIVAVADLVDCLPVESTGCLSGVFDDYPKLETEQERAFGNYESGRYGWVLENVRKLQEPIQVTGHLGLWNWPVVWCDSCYGTGLMEGWNRRDGWPCPKCKGIGIVPEVAA